MDEFAIKPPILIGAKFYDFALEDVRAIQAGTIEVEVYRDSAAPIPGNFGQRWIKLIDEDVRIKIDRLLISCGSVPEMPLKEC